MSSMCEKVKKNYRHSYCSCGFICESLMYSSYNIRTFDFSFMVVPTQYGIALSMCVYHPRQRPLGRHTLKRIRTIRRWLPLVHGPFCKTIESGLPFPNDLSSDFFDSLDFPVTLVCTCVFFILFSYAVCVAQRFAHLFVCTLGKAVEIIDTSSESIPAGYVSSRRSAKNGRIDQPVYTSRID